MGFNGRFKGEWFSDLIKFLEVFCVSHGECVGDAERLCEDLGCEGQNSSASLFCPSKVVGSP